MDVIFRPDQQLASATFFDGEGPQAKEIFSGKVAKEYATNRQAGLRWLELKGEYDAEREALKAEEEAAAASTTAGPDPLVLISGLESQLAEARGALEAVQSKQSEMVLATPEMVLANAGQLHRVSGMAADLEARGLAHIQQADALMARCEARQIELESRISDLAAQAGAIIADVRSTVASFIAESTRKVANAISKRITGLEITTSKLRGPKGNTGNNGNSFEVVPGNPNEATPQQLELIYRRPVQAGDYGLQQQNTGWKMWRLGADGRWGPAALMERDISVVSQPIRAYADVTYAPVSLPPRQPASGGSAESFRVPAVSEGASTVIANDGRYAVRTGVKPAIACTASITLTATTGANAGKSSTVTGKLLYDAATGQTSWVEYAMLGDLQAVPDVAIAMAASIPIYDGPNQITGSDPSPMAQLQITGIQGSDATAGAAFGLSGFCLWDLSSEAMKLGPQWSASWEVS